jgi:DNA (cytosine-5)-methyltransferase 1
MTRPLLLDLFCGAGGAATGYHQAGFDIIGIDINPQPNYPFDFVQADALQWLDGGLPPAITAIHASPPCQHYTSLAKGTNRNADRHPALIPAVRRQLIATKLPYIIENVEAAPLAIPVRLCGSSFGLDLRRHRLFETNVMIWSLPCDHAWQTPRFRSLDRRRGTALSTVVGVHGHQNYANELRLRRQAMGIDWMTNAELVQAIPPAYTEYIGTQLLQALEGAA